MAGLRPTVAHPGSRRRPPGSVGASSFVRRALHARSAAPSYQPLKPGSLNVII